MHAWLCDDTSCNNLQANTTYYFADANNSQHGSNRFTTMNGGDGPNTAILADWSQASYFGSGYSYWTGARATGSGNSPLSWGTTVWSTGHSCISYTNSAGGNAGCQGVAGAGICDGTSAPLGEYGGQSECSCGSNGLICNTTQHLICYVNP